MSILIEWRHIRLEVSTSTIFAARNMQQGEDRGPLILGTICAVTALSTIFSAGRLFVRGKLQGRLFFDDFAISVSVLATWLTVVFQFIAVRHGNGRHVEDLTQDQRDSVSHWTMIGFIPGIVSFATPKLATVDLLCRILLPSRRHRIFLWLLGWICWVQLMVTAVFLLIRCDGKHPWTPSSQRGCVEPAFNIDWDIYTGAFSAFVDLYLALYPTWVLCQLRLSLGKKIGLSIALGFGFISSIIATYKCTRIPTLASPDFSYDTSTLVIWTCVEGSMIIIAACIPILKPLLDAATERCTRLTTSAYSGFSSRYPGASGNGPGTKGKPSGLQDGTDLFPLTAAEQTVTTTTTAHAQKAPKPPKAKPSRNFSLHHSVQGERSRPEESLGYMSEHSHAYTSSQDSILHARTQCSPREDIGVAEPQKRHHHMHNKSFEIAKQLQLQYGGIMRTDSIEISHSRAKECSSGVGEVEEGVSRVK